jgi:hypothetical protein
MTTEFANSNKITAKVGTRCDFVISPKNAETTPLISYNAFETDRVSKDGLKEYEMAIVILSKSVKELLEIYDVCQDVIDNDVQGFTTYFLGSSPVDVVEDRDDLFVVDLNYRVEYKP